MSQSPEEIRADIEQTRSELGTNVDALADKVSPSSIVQRQTDKIRGGISNVKEAVMGKADDVTGSMHDAAQNAGGTLQDAPGRLADKAKGQARGNPLAAGLVAFGAGWLVSSLIPASAPERDAAAAVKEKAQPLIDEAGNVARDMAQNLKEPARQAMDEVKSTATDSASVVRDEAAGAADDVKVRAQEAKDNVKDAGTGSSI